MILVLWVRRTRLENFVPIQKEYFCYPKTVDQHGIVRPTSAKFLNICKKVKTTKGAKETAQIFLLWSVDCLRVVQSCATIRQ